MRILCFLKGIIYSISTFQIVNGHDYQETYNDEKVQILKCIKCGHISKAWWNNQ